MSRLLACCLLLAAAAGLPGCKVLGAGIYRVFGPADNPAVYVPAKEPTLVLVENYRRPGASSVEADLLTRYIERHLEENKVGPLVDSSRIHDLRRENPEKFRSYSTAELARQLGAKQVIYVDLVSASVEPIMGGEAMRGEASALVRVIDAATGERRWPSDLADGYPVSHSAKWDNPHQTRSVSEVQEAVFQALGEKTARLFYKWKPQYDEPEGFNVQ